MKKHQHYSCVRSPTAGEHLGVLISLARMDAGLKQSELGERLGRSHSAVSDIERGKTRIDLDLLAEVAKAIGVKPSKLAIPVLHRLDGLG